MHRHHGRYRESAHPRGIDARLFAELDGLPGGYAIYKKPDAIAEGLAGRSDLDIIVDPQALPKLRSTMAGFGGFRGIPHWLHDNALAEREDWFVPAGRLRLLHFDIAHAIMAGPKFSKRYRTFLLHHLQIARTQQDGLDLPVVHPRDRARIALVRFAFAPRLAVRSRWWIEAEGELAAALSAAVRDHSGETLFMMKFGEVEAPVLVKRQEGRFRIDAVSLSGLRRAIRQAYRVGRFSSISEAAHHYVRRGIFALYRRAGKLLPGPPAHQRRLALGCVVALIGPDGVGKSTQVKRQLSTFGRRFRCASAYLGSNDGSWMRFRRSLGRGENALADESTREAKAYRKPVEARGWMHATGSAAWRLLMGVRRFLVVQRSLRLARSGVLVITDRWPQSLAEGMLDGPSRSPQAKYRLASAMSRVEKRLYDAMSRHLPDLAIYLVAPFAVSRARKPGDIDRADFEARLAVMGRMRESHPSAVTVDASQPLDDVTEQVFGHICAYLGRA